MLEQGNVGRARAGSALCDAETPVIARVAQDEHTCAWYSVLRVMRVPDLREVRIFLDAEPYATRSMTSGGVPAPERGCSMDVGKLRDMLARLETRDRFALVVPTSDGGGALYRVDYSGPDIPVGSGGVFVFQAVGSPHGELRPGAY